MFAQQLLQKVITYEKTNNTLRYEKKMLMDAKLKSDAQSLENLSLLYSIVADNLLSNKTN